MEIPIKHLPPLVNAFFVVTYIHGRRSLARNYADTLRRNHHACVYIRLRWGAIIESLLSNAGLTCIGPFDNSFCFTSCCYPASCDCFSLVNIHCFFIVCKVHLAQRICVESCLTQRHLRRVCSIFSIILLEFRISMGCRNIWTHLTLHLRNWFF